MTISIKPTASGSTIEQDGSLVLSIDSNQNVGIGTSSPTNNLQIYNNGATNGQIHITNSSTGATATDGVLFGYDGSNDVLINNQEATAMKFNNNGSERMRIDSSGYVTEPNKPMAFAVSAPQTSTSPGSPIVLKYALATYNPGSHYNTTTGLFTCPVAGRYKITQHAMAIASAYTFSISITKNGGGLTNGYTSNTTYNISTCMAIINCAANDTLSATLNHGTKHPGFDSFTVEFLG